jgi:hypothetical protein
VPGERANDREAQNHQRYRGEIPWLCVEGERTYLGRSVACHGIVRVNKFALTVRQKSAAGVVVVKTVKAQTVGSGK